MPRHHYRRTEQLSSWRKAHELTFGAVTYTRGMRLVRLAKYGCYSAAAAVSYLNPSLLVAGAFNVTPGWAAFSYVWSTILLFGSLASFIGVATRTWVGEYIGLWGVIAALAVYSFSGFTVEVNGSRIVLGFLACGFTWSAVARRQDVAQAKRLAEYARRAQAGRRGL